MSTAESNNGIRRIRLFVSYDGTNYHGWQVQNNGVTIESELNRAISDLTGEEVRVIGASRTDAGVHALCNVAVYDTASPIPAQKVCYALNARLPEDIRIVRSDEVPPDWHPRKCKTSKTYEYHIFTGEIMDPTRRLYSHHVYRKLDLDSMREAAACLVGEHDFKSFCQENTKVESTVRTIHQLELDYQPQVQDLCIRVKGNGFLYNMVRIIVGTLLEVGYGRLKSSDIPLILEKKDRNAAGPTAPAKGLILVESQFQ